jgi:hypothetical protein
MEIGRMFDIECKWGAKGPYVVISDLLKKQTVELPTKASNNWEMVEECERYFKRCHIEIAHKCINEFTHGVVLTTGDLLTELGPVEVGVI